jgi:hypothetical protein
MVFKCSKCNYETMFSSHYEKHMISIKHNAFYCDVCNKSYKTRSGLWKHKDKLHNTKMNQTDNERIEKITQIIKNTINNQDDKNSVLENTIKNQEKIINALIPKVGNTINNKISINVFLEQKCTNAINFNDFLKQIKVDLHDLYLTKELGYVDGISNIFMKQLDDMATTDRPIHCSDKKRLHFYIKDRDEWNKGERTTVEYAISQVARQQISQIKEWEKEHPNWDKNPKCTDEYLKLIKVVMGGSTDEEQVKNTKGIVRKLGDKLHLTEDIMINDKY